MEYPDIPKKIKELRNKKKISIQEIAKKANLTPGYLSKIENSEKPPPIPTLIKIAYALNVHISHFFDEEKPKDDLSLIRKDQRKEIVGDLTQLGYKYEAVVHKRFDSNINPFVMTLPAEVDPETIRYNSHEGEELIYVLQGDMIFQYGDNDYHVAEGDCLYFSSIVPHRIIRASEEGQASILAVLFFHNSR